MPRKSGREREHRWPEPCRRAETSCQPPAQPSYRVTVRSRLVLPVLVVAAVAALSVSASAGGAAPACRASHLHGKLIGSSGAAGTIVVSITLTNRGSYCS